jgi:beta-lactamase regulating signal transducer with metallopeptidase domain
METIDRSLLTFFLNALWQAPLAAGVAAVVCRLMRNGPARHRHAVCVAALATGLLLPLASVQRGSADAKTFAVQGPSIPAAAPQAAAKGSKAAPATADAPARQGIPLPRTAAWLLIGGYALLVAWRAGRFAMQAVRTRRIVREAEPCSSAVMSRVWARCAQAMEVKAELRCSSAIDGPVTAGRTIILPVGMLNETSEPILTTAIGHEMAHIRRGDFAWNLWYEAIALPVWFHPATAWLRRQIDRTRELACDDLVTERLLEPGAYAESIVSIAAAISGLRQPGYTLGVLDGDILQERIERLLHRPAADLKRARLMLAAGLSALAVCLVGASTLAISARAQSVAQPEMKLAGQAFNNGDYAGAVSHFERAVALEPGNVNARLFLANAYIRQSVAGKEPALREKAQEQYQAALDRDPKNVSAMFGLASLRGPEHAKESRALMLKAIEIDPTNKNAYYAAGVADWTMAYVPIRDANGGMGPNMYRQIADAGMRSKLREQLLPAIEDGFRMLQIALDLDPQFSDAMAYMNLLARLKAPLMDAAAEHDTLMANADEWVHKALSVRRTGAKGAPQIDVDQPAPMAIPAAVPPPPPPPPPPPGGIRGNGDKGK